ncbi:CLUMA_CG010853, isoform A [Clunio marinus]|uniref:CLUMA_CG010853, isoform A n=1 Tax=Clunio marinus TaxID=568069 RepID=A0A1J1IB57_9DIPT|nr:CLUMA_CG010853, isoform A [Clunio marinus]
MKHFMALLVNDDYKVCNIITQNCESKQFLNDFIQSDYHIINAIHLSLSWHLLSFPMRGIKR